MSAKKRTRGDNAQLDAVIVGAGMAGLYAIHHLREKGLTVQAFEAGTDVGGTWYWNRYPGARVDIESMEYAYSFSKELQQDWEWSERYSAQPELQRYFAHVADRFDLRKHIRFETRVVSAIFDEDRLIWTIRTDQGDVVEARYCLMATGFLSAPNKPAFDGVERYEGEQYHTAYWPHEKVDFTGKRVGIIGTGSSAVQSIPHIAQDAEHLYVFQRTPGYCIPARNHPMPADYQNRVKNDYDRWRHIERYESYGGFVALNYEPAVKVDKSALEVSEAERQAFYEERWKSGGLAFYSIYNDLFTDAKANETLAEFVRAKIRERIKDPALREKLVPDYPILMKRLIADTDYYETFERDNVTLVDVKNAPIEEITATGVKTGGKVYDLDAIVFATGFDAMTGAMLRIDIRGRGGRHLKDHWADGARTHLGLMVAGFPNMFMLDGTGAIGPVYSPILITEEQVEWVAAAIGHLESRQLATIEATEAAEEAYADACREALEGSLFPTVKSWYVGSNIEGKKPYGLIFLGGIEAYRDGMQDAAKSGYKDFVLGPAGAPPPEGNRAAAE